MQKKYLIKQSQNSIHIVFISHDAGLSGAPILLLNLLQLIKEKQWASFDIIVQRGGVLENNFRDIGATIILKKATYQAGKSFLSKVIDYLGYRRQLTRARKVLHKSSYVLSNTVANGRLLRTLNINAQKDILIYVHELEEAIQFCNKHYDSELSFHLGKKFVFPSQAVANNLQSRHGIFLDKLFPLNYFFNRVPLNIPSNLTEQRLEFRRRFEIPLDSFLVAAVGTAALRKGVDLFVDVCQHSAVSSKNLHFVWIGGFVDRNLETDIKEKVTSLCLEKNLTFTGAIKPENLSLSSIDLLCLPSREDPYPLVVLEAAMQKIPSIIFRGSGGIGEFIQDDAGFQIDDFSTRAMGAQIQTLSVSPEILSNAGERAYERVLDLHCSRELILSQLSRLIPINNTEKFS